MREALQRAWRGRGPLAVLMLPLAWTYGALSALRRLFYRTGLVRTRRAAVPVIVIGNVVAGGAGKTPVVMAVVDHLRGRGLHPGVISRGYGRRARDCRLVTTACTAAEVGDEPLLVARQSRVPVAVAARRIDAARALLQARPEVDVLVCDDGLQHLALARDVEVCVFDARGAGNGWLLPAGPLREAWPRAVDLVLRPPGTPGIDGHAVARRLATHAVRADGTRRALAEFAGERCIAVAGIAQPQGFFAMLRAAGLTLAEAVALPDHYDFESGLRSVDARCSLICTEKDAVKLWRHDPLAWAVPLVLEIDAGFWRALDALLAAKLSFRDGSQTA